MPTISEPIRPTPASLFHTGRGQLDVAGHLRAIELDFAEIGIRLTPLGALARALDAGVPEEIAVAIAELVPSQS